MFTFADMASMEVNETTEIVNKILQQNEVKYKSTEVIKDIDVELDLGNLLAVDPNPLESKELRSNRNLYLLSCARDGIQLLVNELWKLPVQLVDNVHVVKLPAPKTAIPREKPIPAAKKLTRWEQYSKLKGVQKRKKGRMVWDENSKEWTPRWGYKRANDVSNEWLIEVPDQADPLEDQFAKRQKQKKERIAKNELQRLRNIARNMKGKVPGVGLTPVDKPDKDHVAKALAQARKSTASIGKFDQSLPKEKPAKNEGKKRKFESNLGDMSKEKKRSLDILQKVADHQPILDVAKSANRLKAAEEVKRSEKRQSDDRPRKQKSQKKKGGGGGNNKKHGSADRGHFGGKGRGKGKQSKSKR